MAERKGSERGLWNFLKKIIVEFLKRVDKMMEKGIKQERGVGVIEDVAGVKGVKAFYDYKITLGLDKLPETIHLKRKKALRK